MWEMCDTTKRHIGEAVNAHRQHNVAVFHIVNFHRIRLEIGVHASRQLARRVADRIKQALEPGVDVSTEQGGAGTFLVLLPGDREAVERATSALVQGFEADPVSITGRDVTTQVTLACGIIAFPQAGVPLSRSILLARLDVDPAAPIGR
jgi:GGDEF domain-containing protein